MKSLRFVRRVRPVRLIQADQALPCRGRRRDLSDCFRLVFVETQEVGSPLFRSSGHERVDVHLEVISIEGPVPIERLHADSSALVFRQSSTDVALAQNQVIKSHVQASLA
jgi:hypothetical protein